MSVRTNFLPDDIYAYMLDTTLREPAIMRELRDETSRMPN
ncbi:MAG: SAM-dependent methyltransferase, partial [Candidatus Eremiobacteraeota bacterium]|nr:SAM-dependent methyltransferase [Candidatus Eremiobacteraeota bacterium]